MQVVIWCGGKGTRLYEMTEFIPKPLVPIGNRPVLWHIMKIYSHFGFNEFILCLGYKGEMIKDYFLNYPIKVSDFTTTLHLKEPLKFHSNSLEDWRLTFVDTGIETLTGGRLLKIKNFLKNEKTFMATYSDGLADIDINNLLEFHKKMGKIVTITGGHPYSKYGLLEITSDNIVLSLKQKPKIGEFTNIGFMVFETEVFEYIKTDTTIEEVLMGLIKDEQVVMYKHENFFHPMDTYKDYEDLNSMWNSGAATWKIWENKE